MMEEKFTADNAFTIFDQKKHNTLLRFLHFYLISYVFIFMLTSQFSPFEGLYKEGVLWLCENIFRQNVEYIKMTGSGDTTLDYWVLNVNFSIAIVSAIIMFILIKKKQTFQDLHWFMVVIARYYVAMIMLSYGFAKLHDGQFPTNSIARLEEKVGDMSPMGMVWSMMGASAGYTFVSGLLEAFGALLLLFRRTKTFGALFSMTVMINVALLNFFYDVPVKIFSSHIVFLCIFILSVDVVALYRFFVLHKPTQLRFQKRTSDKKWKNVMLTGLKWLVVVFLLFRSSSSLFYVPPAEPMEGLYTVEKFVINNQQVTSCGSDSIGWKKLIISGYGRMNVIFNNDSTKVFEGTLDTAKKTIKLKTEWDDRFAKLHYEEQKDNIIFKGKFGQDTVIVKTVRKKKEDYRLNKRGFHWINEYPFNR